MDCSVCSVVRPVSPADWMMRCECVYLHTWECSWRAGSADGRGWHWRHCWRTRTSYWAVVQHTDGCVRQRARRAQRRHSTSEDETAMELSQSAWNWWVVPPWLTLTTLVQLHCHTTTTTALVLQRCLVDQLTGMSTHCWLQTVVDTCRHSLQIPLITRVTLY